MQTKLVQKTCTRCGHTKPIKDFKRRLTLRQSQALLRRPHLKTPTTLISSRCKDCWHETKRRTPLTLKDIQNKKESGDLHVVKADLLIKQIRENRNAKRARVMKEYWQKQKQKPIDELTLNLRQQVAQYKSRYHALKSQTKNKPDPHHALLPQHRESYEQAKQIRNDLLARAKAGEVIDPQIKIATLLKPNERKHHD